MFQYAFGLSLSKKMKAPLYFDLSFYKQDTGLTPRRYELGVFTPSANIAGHGLVKSFLKPNLAQFFFNKNTVYRESTLRFTGDVFNVKPSVYFEGFWQSEQYFIGIENEVRNAFTFKVKLNVQSQKIADELAQHPNAVSIHVRRADYVSSKATNELHGLCSVKYYRDAITMIKDETLDPYFYFFSDDPDWVRENLLPGVESAALIQHNTGLDSWQDMVLMSKCKHHIIANSSFSWWGAWLNPYKEKMVITPKHWFNGKMDYFNDQDIVPKDWIRLPNE
ncbi:MAG: hypothetical protein JWQ54_1607 [Mucilaginibacter sp.]|nr:hypothetical protein [Mucilaginibacter sp.]